MEAVVEFLSQVLANLGMLFLALACAVGVFLSALSISGTWVVVGACLLAFLFSGGGFPGLGVLLFFIYVSILVEVVEYVAGIWGVARRGGSAWAGFAAVVGGIFGVMIGSLLPIPLVGGLIGMLACSFGLVYAVENIRLKESGRASHIAWGAVVSRMFVVLIKVLVTIGMSAWLIIGLLRK